MNLNRYLGQGLETHFSGQISSAPDNLVDMNIEKGRLALSSNKTNITREFVMKFIYA
jgi:hypothetical protein